MAAVAQPDQRDAGLRAPSRCRVAPANSPTTWPKPRLPSTIAIVSLSNTSVGVRVGPQVALAHPFEILADAQHAVRIVPDEVGVDEATRDGPRFVGAAAGAFHDGGDEIDETFGADDTHGGARRPERPVDREACGS